MNMENKPIDAFKKLEELKSEDKKTTNIEDGSDENKEEINKEEVIDGFKKNIKNLFGGK